MMKGRTLIMTEERRKRKKNKNKPQVPALELAPCPKWDWDLMKHRLQAPPMDFLADGFSLKQLPGKDRYYLFRGGNHKVLAVAHLDTVQNLPHFFGDRIGDSSYVFASQMDDRLGVHLLLDILPQYVVFP